MQTLLENPTYSLGPFLVTEHKMASHLLLVDRLATGNFEGVLEVIRNSALFDYRIFIRLLSSRRAAIAVTQLADDQLLCLRTDDPTGEARISVSLDLRSGSIQAFREPPRVSHSVTVRRQIERIDLDEARLAFVHAFTVGDLKVRISQLGWND